MFSSIVSHIRQVPAISLIAPACFAISAEALRAFPFSLSLIPAFFSCSAFFDSAPEIFSSFSRISIMWLSSIRA